MGPRLRQRCSWCGAVLADYDLTRGAGDGIGSPPMWEQGSLVRVDGNLMVALEHEQGADIPEGGCAWLPDEITA